MRTMMLAGTFALIGVVAAGCAQPGYGPGYGYGQGYGAPPAYGYGAPPAYGYGAQPAYYGQPAYSQPAANPMTQILGAMLSPSSGYGNTGYYQPAPSYGWR